MAKRLSTRQASIESLKERMARDPFSRAFLQLAEEYRKDGQFEGAVRVCLEGLNRHPTYHTARISLGRTYLEMGDLENARKTLSEVLELAPENHLAGKLLAEVQRRMGDVPGAVGTYRAILRHYPDDREVQVLLNDLLASPEPAVPAPPAGAAPPGEARPATAPRAGRSSPASGAKAPASPPSPPAAPRLAATAKAPPAAPGSAPEVDYRPEDLAPAAPPVLETRPPGRPEGAGKGSDALQTNTLAELYLRQGLVDRAVEVYRAMLRVDPGNERARGRLKDLLAGSRAAPGAVAAGSPETGLPPPRGETPPRTAVPGSDRRVAVARLERWLKAIRAGSPSGGAAARR